MDDEVRCNDVFQTADGKFGHIREDASDLFYDYKTNNRPIYGVGTWKDVVLFARNITFKVFIILDMSLMEKESNG